MNPFKWLRSSSNGDDRHAGAHMTWAKTSVGRTISRTGLFLKRQIWIWPIVAVVLLSLIGLFVRRAIETTMREGLQSELQTVVDLEDTSQLVRRRAHALDAVEQAVVGQDPPPGRLVVR
jgi:hypothetical protein